MKKEYYSCLDCRQKSKKALLIGEMHVYETKENPFERETIQIDLNDNLYSMLDKDGKIVLERIDSFLEKKFNKRMYFEDNNLIQVCSKCYSLNIH